MNNINNNQNEEENLLLLYSQKNLYDKSKKIKYYAILLALVCFLLGILSELIVGYEGHFTILIFFITATTKYLKNNSYKFNNLAAATQELIDRRLFGFEIENRHLDNHTISEILSVAKDLKEKYPEKYLININNTGTDSPNGVKDWYTNIPSNLQVKDAILKCQKQNIYWDKLLIDSYRKILIFLIFFVAIIFFILYWNKSVYNFIVGVISSFSICEIIINEFVMSTNFKSINTEINCIIDTLDRSNIINTNDLKELQAKIFERRKSDFNVPSFIHKINRITIHHKYNRDN